MTRKAIQISSYDWWIDILCDDGTMWTLNWTWKKMPDIPQD